MQERIVTWTTEKNSENIRKHHISFEVAQYVFSDQERIERLDRSESNTSGEERWQTIGRVGKLLFVVYMESDNEMRIISAAQSGKAGKEKLQWLISH